jgi:hypothetical protein
MAIKRLYNILCCGYVYYCLVKSMLVGSSTFGACCGIQVYHDDIMVNKQHRLYFVLSSTLQFFYL